MAFQGVPSPNPLPEGDGFWLPLSLVTTRLTSLVSCPLPEGEGFWFPSPSGRGAGGEGSKITSAPPRWAASWARTRSGGSTAPQQRQVALARLTVPPRTSFSVGGVKISNSTRGVPSPNPLPEGEGFWLPSPSGRGVGGEGKVP